jgi:hypothetical protein
MNFDHWKSNDTSGPETTNCAWCGVTCTREYCSVECAKLDDIWFATLEDKDDLDESE